MAVLQNKTGATQYIAGRSWENDGFLNTDVLIRADATSDFVSPIAKTLLQGFRDGDWIITSGAIGDFSQQKGGYEYTAGLTDRLTGTIGTDLGSNVSYTQEMVDLGQWYRFGFDTTRQVANDSPYWSDPTPPPHSDKGLFGGAYGPTGTTNIIDYTDTSTSAAQVVGDLKYTAATGSFNFKECMVGDFLNVRFDINIVPQIVNTTVELALIWHTRDANDNITFSFPLTTQPIYLGQGAVGKTYLARPIITAYFASNEDINARALCAIRADNPILVQPLAVLPVIIR